MGFPFWAMIKGGGKVRHFQKARGGEHVVAKLCGGRHEQIRCNRELEARKRFGAALGIGGGHQGVGAEVQKSFNGIGSLFEDRSKNIVGCAIARLRRWAERFFLPADAQRRHFLGQKFFAAYVVYGNFREGDVAARAVDVAKQRIKRRNRAAGLRGVGMLAETVPHVHTYGPVVRQQQRGLPDFIGWHGGDLFGALRSEGGGDFAEALEDRRAGNFIAIFSLERAHAKEGRLYAVRFVTAHAGVINRGAIFWFVPYDVAIGVSSGNYIRFGDDFSGRAVQQKRPVGPLPGKCGVEPTLLHHTVNQRQRKSAVASRPDLKQHVSLAADADAARINHDGFHSPRPRRDDVMGQHQRCRAGIVSPKQKSFAMREVRCRQIGAECVAESRVPVPVAYVGRGYPVRAAEQVEKTAQPAFDIIDRSTALRSFSKSHRLGTVLFTNRL